MIRPALSSDAAAVLDLWTQGYVDEGESGRTEPYVAVEYEQAARRGTLPVAVRESEVVGVVALWWPLARRSRASASSDHGAPRPARRMRLSDEAGAGRRMRSWRT